jgi:hypothetical protein
MPPKANTIREVPRATEAGTSGKLVIIGILTAALAAAGTSWWFRYHTTHRAAEFLEPQIARLIRDAPIVEFCKIDPPLEATLPTREAGQLDQLANAASRRNVTEAHGLVHLRNALIEDHSYTWPAQPPSAEDRWQWGLQFRDDSTRAGATLLFSPDCKHLLSLERPTEVLSCETIAPGLAEMFAEFAAMPTDAAATPASEPAAPAR